MIGALACNMKYAGKLLYAYTRVHLRQKTCEKKFQNEIKYKKKKVVRKIVEKHLRLDRKLNNCNRKQIEITFSHMWLPLQDNEIYECLVCLCVL